MSFPLDPNAPGGPGRAEFVRRSLAAAEARMARDANRDSDVSTRQIASEEREGLRRLEALLMTSIFGV